MHADQFIGELATRLRLPKLEFNDERVCRLILNNQYTIDLELVEPVGAIQVYSVIHSRAAELQPRYAEILAANLFGNKTHDAVLALDRERDEVILHRKFILERLDLDWFVKQLDVFVDAVAAWTQHLLRPHIPHDAGELTTLEHEASGLLRV